MAAPSVPVASRLGVAVDHLPSGTNGRAGSRSRCCSTPSAHSRAAFCATYKSVEDEDATIVVLISEILPNKRRHEILHNQRARVLSEVLKARTNVVIATLPFHLHD
jgi:hypothetical protein